MALFALRCVLIFNFMKCVYNDAGTCDMGISPVWRFTVFKEISPSVLYIHTLPFLTFIIFALLFICVQKFQTMLVFQLWICDEAPPSHLLVSVVNYLSGRT